ncbi:unnamed protein product [Ixodes persulcatus]
MKVCSAHFVDDDFFWSHTDTQVWTPVRKRLKKTAVPSQHLPVRSHDYHDLMRVQASAARTARASARCDPRNILSLSMQGAQDEQETALDGTVSDGATTADTLTECAVAEALLQLAGCIHGCTDKDVQVDTASLAPKKVKLVDWLSTDSAVCAYTGIESMSALAAISKEVAAIDKMATEISVLERVVLVLVRLKTCLSFTCLATLFGISKTTVHRHFYGTLPSLAAVLEAAIPWPTKAEISRNEPQCFAEYRDVRVVLDCTEVQVEKSHCASCRILTYSQYKGGHTAKALVGVSPAGLITFLSNGFGGRASDKACVEKSGVLNKLTSFEDDVMVDKGFSMDAMCGKLGLGVVQPPFLRSQTQFSAEDANRTVKIARARVHVERAIQRMKVFKVLKGPVPWEMVAALDDIMIIIAGIVNVSAPILSEKRF